MKSIQKLPIKSYWRNLISATFLTVALLMCPGLFAQDPASVTLPGSFQDELGCPGDWQPDCMNTALALDPFDGVWQGVFTIPAGAWEYKAAIDGSWDENYGANAIPGGPNIALSLADETDVKFYYDHKTHWITDNVNSVIAVAVGNFQFALGCGGDWQPDCLQSWLQDPDGDGIFTFTTNQIPFGNYEAKVAINESWDENYGEGGAPNGPNIPFFIPYDWALTNFIYDSFSHVLQIIVTDQPASVTIAGNLQSELGCPGDWQPDCSNTYLNLFLSDNIWRGVFTVPAGDWEYKATINNSWDENYGANATPNGPNILLSLGGDTEVRFYYDHKTHWVTDNVNSVIAVAVGDFQSELGGCGDWQPECMRSWLQDADGDGIYTFHTNQIPEGPWEVKVAHDESWTENYGEGGVPNGPNIQFNVPYGGAWMLFSYNPDDHILTVEQQDPPPGTIIIKKWTNPPTTDVDFGFTTFHLLSVQSPEPIAGDYPAGSAFFGPTLDITGITGELELVDDAVDPTANGCEPLAGFTPGKIAVIDRGFCTFVLKVQHAQDAGAIAAVIVNNIPGGGVVNMGGEDPGLTIPAIMVSFEDGEMIKAAMASETVVATLRSESVGQFTLQHDQEIVINDLPMGNYHFMELNPTGLGFQLVNIEIADPDGESTADPGQGLAMIDLDPGETVYCTFINEACALYSIEPPEITVSVPSGGTAAIPVNLNNHPDPGGKELHYFIMSPFTDDFESYASGVQLACQNPMQWNTWNNTPCSFQDPFVSSDYAQSGSNSVVIKRNEEGDPVGLVRHMNVPVGVWEISFGMYVPGGKSGFFQCVAGFDPGPVLALTCNLEPGGNGIFTAGAPDPVTFDFAHDEWQQVMIIANMEADLGEFWLNGVLVHTWTWTDGLGTGAPLHLAMINFYSQTENDELYFDDFAFRNYPDCSFVSSVTPNAGLVPDGEVQELMVELDAAGLPLGEYMCHIWINGNSCFGPQMMPVSMTVFEDNEPPVINLAGPAELWPANHKHQIFSLEDMVVSVEDNADGMIPIDQVSIEWASSDEPDDAPGNGDGNTVNDIKIADDCKSVKLRKERQGGGNGRVYTVKLYVSDAAGNIGTALYQVFVPHDQGSMAIYDGPYFMEYCDMYGKIAQVDDLKGPENETGLINIPNPFSGSTLITFMMEAAEAVQVKVYNAMGEEVVTLFDGMSEAGLKQEIEFGADGLPGGVYYCRLQSASGIHALRKMVLIR